MEKIITKHEKEDRVDVIETVLLEGEIVDEFHYSYKK